MEPNAARSGSRSAQHENRSTLARHRAISSASWNVRFSLSPVAAYYGLRAPTFSSGAYPQPAMPMGGNSLATSMAHLMPNMNLPPAAMGMTYTPNTGRPLFQPSTSATTQAPTMPLHTNEQPPARNMVIITNLHSEVKQHQLAQNLG